jgi:hypothetical protein
MHLPKDILSGLVVAPDFYLCEVDKEIIGGINIYEPHGTFKFNTYGEITCKFSRFYTDSITGENNVHPLYDKVEALRVLYIIGFGFFQIQSANIISDGIQEYKDITAYSLEYELTQKFLEDFVINMGLDESIDGVQLYNILDTSKSLLHLVLEKMPGWSVGHVDDSLVDLKRSFEVDRQAIYDFIMNDMASTFKVVVKFDTYNRTINVYEEESAGSDTNIYVSLDSIASEVQVDYSADDIKTVLSVTGADDLTIREVNLGLPYIMNLDYYNTIDWFGEDLYNAYNAYVKKVDGHRERYSDLMLQWDELYDQRSKLYNMIPDYEESDDKDITVVPSYDKLPQASEEYVFGRFKVDDGENVFYYVCKATIVDDVTQYVWEIDIDNISSFATFPEPSIKYVGGVYKIYNTNSTKGALYYICESYVGEDNKTEYRWVFANADYGIKMLKEKEEVYLTIQEVQVSAGWAEPSNANHHRYINTYKCLTDVQSQLAERQKEADAISESMNALAEKMAEISKDIAMENNFTEKQMVRLSPFLREDEYSDDCFVVTDLDDDKSALDVKRELLNASEKELVKISQPQLAFSMDIANILAIPEFEPITKDFEKGNYIRIEIREGYVVKSQILEIDIAFDDMSEFNVTCGNLTSLYSQADIHAQLLSSAVTAGKSVASHSSYWQKGANKATSIDKQIEQGLINATTSIKTNSVNQAISYDNHGIHLRKYKDGTTDEYEDTQIWMNNEQILFTDDNFRTSKTALGKVNVNGEDFFGIIAQGVVSGFVKGSQIIGSTIQIGERADGSYAFEITADGTIVMRGGDGEETVGGSIASGFTSVRITSTGSTYFTDTNQSAVLTAHVYFGGNDITYKYDRSVFHWIRKSDDSAADTLWNIDHIGMKSITITPNDVQKNAQFYCSVDI